jgi:Parvulin-like peptidyl-prolyl isomerase
MARSARIAAAVLAVFLAVTALYGCAEDSDNPMVLTIGGEGVPLDEFQYFYYNTKADYDNGDDSYWSDTTKINKLYDDVLYTLRRNRAIEDMAKEYNIELSSTVKSSISSYLTQTKESYSDESQYYSSLDSSHMSERMFGEVLQLQELWQELYDYVTDEASGVIFADDATLLADIPLHFYRATHILIMNDEGDDPAANKALAEEILQRLNNGEDFETLKTEYGEDSKLDGNTDGYYFTDGQMIESFEAAVKSLKVGETSGVVESIYGYHIIRRLPLEESYINEHLEDLRKSYMSRIFNDKLKAKADSYDVKFTDTFKTLDILPYQTDETT